jgi:hypothetical protein
MRRRYPADRHLANPELGPLAQQITDQMDALFADFSAPHAHEVSRWMRANMMIFGRAPARAKNIQGQMENLAKLLSEVPKWGALQNKPFYNQVWQNIVPFLEEVEALALKETVEKEVKVDGHKFVNEAGLSAESFDKYVKAMLALFQQIKGWRRGALTDGVTVVFAGPKSFRGTAAGTYRSAQDQLLVRATPAVLKRGSGTYGAPDYIIIHELGHRFERKHRLPEDFDKVQWTTTKYSQKEGETFAELFALGHFGLETVHGDTFGDRLARFEDVMGARANPAYLTDAGLIAIKAMRRAPEGSLLVSEDGGIAWRKIGPGQHGRGDWARLKPSTSSPDGWQRTVNAYGQPMPPDDWEQIKRFVMREGVLVVPPA